MEEKKIDCVIVEERPYYPFTVCKELREWLAIGPWVKQTRIPLVSNIEEFKDNALIIYTRLPSE
jgi:hypothetical protein